MTARGRGRRPRSSPIPWPPSSRPPAASRWSATKLYVWALRYTADDYLALLDTFSGHIAMEPDKRAYLYREIRRLLAARPDGRLTRHWSAVLTVGRRR